MSETVSPSGTPGAVRTPNPTAASSPSGSTACAPACSAPTTGSSRRPASSSASPARPSSAPPSSPPGSRASWRARSRWRSASTSRCPASATPSVPSWRRRSASCARRPSEELEELTELYEEKGLSRATARQVAVELTEHDALSAHLDAELHLDPDELTSPWRAAGASAVSFTLGALLPLIAVIATPATWRVPVTVVAGARRARARGLGSAPGSAARPRGGRCCG